MESMLKDYEGVKEVTMNDLVNDLNKKKKKKKKPRKKKMKTIKKKVKRIVKRKKMIPAAPVENEKHVSEEEIHSSDDYEVSEVSETDIMARFDQIKTAEFETKLAKLTAAHNEAVENMEQQAKAKACNQKKSNAFRRSASRKGRWAGLPAETLCLVRH